MDWSFVLAVYFERLAFNENRFLSGCLFSVTVHARKPGRWVEGVGIYMDHSQERMTGHAT